MSRLESYRKKQFAKKVFFFTVLLALLIGLLATLGLRALINSSLYISSLFSKNSTDTEQDTRESFFGSLDVINIPTATNSASFILSGSATNYDTLEFYINSEKVKEAIVKNSPNFTVEIGELKKGENKVYIKALSEEAKKEKKTQEYTVLYVSDKPKLEVSEPKESGKTSLQELKIVGKTDKDITIRINLSPVVVDSQGNFQHTIKLKDGENKIEVLAEDDAGNIEKKEITMTYQKDE